MGELATIEPRAKADRIQVIDPVPVLDTGRFEQMVRVAKLMASSNLIPETLCSVTEGSGSERKKTWLPVETVTANCFLIVNQAVGWGMDPFAVAQCASVVHGRVCYEGKLIAAVIEQKLGVRLDYEWDDKLGDALGITVRGTLDGKMREMRGTVRDWKTTGANSPWAKQPRMQLAYRGARDWARLHAPSVMLGVYSSDEMEAAVDRQERLPARPMLVSNDGAHLVSQPSAPARKTPPAPPPPPASALSPPAPKVPPAPPQPQQSAPLTIDFDDLRANLQGATNLDQANAVFDAWFAPREKQMSQEEQDEAQNIFNEVCEPFYRQEGT